MACDLCGKRNVELHLLSKSYRTIDVENVCQDCIDIINKQRYKILSVTDSMYFYFVREYISNFRNLNYKEN